MSFFERIGMVSVALSLIFVLACTAELAPPPADAVWIDTRTAEEFAQGHLEQAALIPYDVIEEGIAALQLSKDAPIYLYCQAGIRAGKAKAALEAQNYTNVINAGGLADARSLASKQTH
jgi:phage shock protein E